MIKGSIKITATPSKENLIATLRELDVELKGFKSSVHEFKCTYNFGIRQLNDVLIDFSRDSDIWPNPQDWEMLVFCQAERGQRITYVEIKVDQSSNHHHAYIVDGGIGKDHIHIMIKSSSTFWLKYDVRVYGTI